MAVSLMGSTSPSEIHAPDVSSPKMLEGGRWELHPIKRVMVWLPGEVQVHTGVYDSRKKRTTLHELRQVRPENVVLACPKCGAMSNESCKTKTGHTTSEHAERTVKRRCACGMNVGSRKTMCSTCSKASYAESQIRHMRQVAARKVARQQACTECSAAPGESCKTLTGKPRPPHRIRTQRPCQCGVPLEFGKKKCDACRTAAVRARYVRRRTKKQEASDDVAC